MMSKLQENLNLYFKCKGGEMKTASLKTRYEALSHAAMGTLSSDWKDPKFAPKRVGYFSAEFLIGRMIHNNLYNLGLLEEAQALLSKDGHSVSDFEEIEDMAFGNGGLGRLAACFLDSAATQDIPLDGYGIRYQYGLFKQGFQEGLQTETADDWEQYGDPWSVRRDEWAVDVTFHDQTVRAVPYDMPVIGYGGKRINFLRLWKAEAKTPFDFARFNDGEYNQAVEEKTQAEALSAVLYPNDSTRAGKALRLKQGYFFSSASLQNILARFIEEEGRDFSKLPQLFTIQLNDTHPVVSIPELLRLLMEQQGLPFDRAFAIVKQVFAFTNHTVMQEALEVWDLKLFSEVLPAVIPYVVLIQEELERTLLAAGLKGEAYQIIRDGKIHMAPLAIYGSYSTNGVSELHSALLKTDVFPHWNRLYPGRLNNKTNGISQRRWLGLSNPEFAAFLRDNIGEGWLYDLNQLENLKAFTEDPGTLAAFAKVKQEKKRQLAAYVKERENIRLNTDFMFFSLCKRIHEYKRQLLDALSLLDTYFGLKDGAIDLTPSLYLYGGKSAPGYERAKGIIKFINEIAAMINRDPAVRNIMQVVFVQNYNVSYAEKIIPATDVSVQISTVGTEASGTGNMKMSLNGALTLGTRDGANVEIVQRAGEENNYMFGPTLDQMKRLKKTHNPRALYEQSPRLKRVVDTLIDGTFHDGGSGIFRELYDALLVGASWHKPDHYHVLSDFAQYVEAKQRVNQAYQDKTAFTGKALKNAASMGFFSSDNTIRAYATDIWLV